VSETPEQRAEQVYELYRRGSELLENGDFAAATIPLEQARDLEREKTSIREALGRAYYRSGRFGPAVEEFGAVVEQDPVNDFAHFCLGRALEKIGRTEQARRHAVLAAGMRPDREDYRVFKDRLREA
jgi:Flp pilus assembly protein TadD